MNFTYATKMIAAGAIAACAAPAFAHIVLETTSAPAGSSFKAVLQVGHGCQGSATTGVTLQVPAGFQGAKPYPKAGWTLAVKSGKLAKPYESHGKQVTEDVTQISWTAASKDAALQDAWFDEFAVRGKLPEAAGPLWFKVLQTCDNGSADWSEVPASGTSTQGLKSPAPLLLVTGGTTVAQVSQVAPPAPGQNVQVANAWIRATVPGQSGSGAFMSLTSKAAMRLVGVATPAAGVADVHEMKMEGDVMRMRAVPGGLALPAGKTVDLKSGGYHVMLMDLKQPLVAGSTVPMTLTFKDAKGKESKVDLSVPVSVTAPAATGAKLGAAAKAEEDHSGHMH
jgi:periplasmic copper chaperone A